ncbi:MAG: hypothetical protein ACRDMX_17195 [Solirubrobacteraceae bacterium]
MTAIAATTGPFATAVAAVTRVLPHPEAVQVVAIPVFPPIVLVDELVFALRREGASLTATPAVAAELGSAYDPRGRDRAVRLVVGYGAHAAPDARLLVSLRVDPPAFPTGTFTVALARSPGAESARAESARPGAESAGDSARTG